jgi:transposase-like protein
MIIKLAQAKARRYSIFMSKRVSKMLTVQEFRSLFGEESGCGEQLSRQRWPDGFQCPRCAGPSRGYMADRRVHECAHCAYQCSVTAGTIFHKTRTPLTSWFWAIYRMSHDKKGISAVQLSKEIGVSYPTAWLIEHKIRKAMEDRDQAYKLSGLIEVDEGYVGGEEHGEAQKGRGAKSKAVVAVAVEHRASGKPGQPPIPGFAALSVVPNAASSSLDGFLNARIEPGSHILTDGWNGYWHVGQNGFTHTAIQLSKQDQPAHKLFPWVHITLSNLKRFLLGTHHNVELKHLARYVAEFNYRLNRRSMEKDLLTRLLRACIGTATITYRQLTTMPELT